MAVYMIRASRSGAVKIGMTGDIKKRLQGLQTSHSERLSVIRAFDGGRDLEQSLHEKFKDLRLTGEWFSYQAEMISDDFGATELNLDQYIDNKTANELIEISGTGELSLQDRRIINLLYENAGQQLCEHTNHRIAIAKLRGPHKGGERVKDSIRRLMQPIVRVPAKDSNGKPKILLTPLLSDTTICEDEDNPAGEVIYTFSEKMRDVIRNSTYWGRVRGAIVYSFTSKYSLSLYELICLRINRKQWHQTFSVEELRSLLGVPNGKLERTPDFLRKVIQPAVIEVNGLAEFGVQIDPVRIGGKKRGAVTGFSVGWWRKDGPALQEAYSELQRSKTGRIERLRGPVQTAAKQRREMVRAALAAPIPDLKLYPSK